MGKSLIPGGGGLLGAGGAAIAGTALTATVLAGVAATVLSNDKTTGQNKLVYGAIGMLDKVAVMMGGDAKKLEEANVAYSKKIYEATTSLEGFKKVLGEMGEGAMALLGLKSPTAANTYNPAGTSGGRHYVSPWVAAHPEAAPGTPAYAGLSDTQVTTVLDIRNAKAELAELTTNFTASLTSMTADFLKSQKRAEEENAAQRAQIIRDGGIEIQRIEQDSQIRLRKLSQEHDDRMYSLALARDALGIVQEQRDYERARDEETENTNLEIKRRRADIALKLSDMQKQFQAERKLALEAYQDQVRVAQAEFNTKRSALQAEIQDLEYALTHEKEVKEAYNQAIIEDAAAFAAEYRATLATAYGATAPSTSNGSGSGIHMHAAGGYAEYGRYVLGDNLGGGRGPREFVLNGRATRAAEGMLGGALTQQNIIEALLSKAGGLHFIDNSRYATTISASDRRSLRREAVADALTIIGAKK